MLLQGRKSPSPPGFARGALGLAWRAVRAALVFVAVLLGLYLLVGNALLFFRVPVGYFETSSKTVRIQYDSAWTWWPGSVWLSDLVVAIQERGEEMEFRAVEASGHIHIDDLARGTFRASNVEADELTYRFRTRREDLPAAEADAAMLPPIGAWGPLAVRDGQPKSPPPTDENYDKWRVVFEDTRATVREVWVEGVRFTGHAAIAGDFDYKPYRWMRLGPTHGRIDDGMVERMGQEKPTLLGGVEASFRLVVPHFPVEEDTVQLLRFMDLDLAGEGFAECGAWLAATGALPGEGASAADGSGPLRAKVAARQGRFLPGSRVEWETVHLEVGTEMGRAVVAGPARVVASAHADDVVKVAAETTAVDVRPAPLAGGLIHAEAASGWLHLRTVPHFLEATFEGGHADVPAANMGLVGLPLSRDVRLEKGIAFARATVDVDRDGRFHGTGRSRVEGLQMRAAGMKITGKAVSDLTLEEATFGDHLRVRAKSFLRLDDMSLVAGDEEVHGWWGRIETSSSIERRGDGPVSTQTRLHTRARDANPARAMLEAANYVPGILGDRMEMEGLVATGTIETLGPRIQVDLAEVTGDGGRVRGRLVESGDQLRAAFLVETPLVDVGIAIAKKKTMVELLAGDGWLAEETAFLGQWRRAATAARGESSKAIR
jgi:hypothetical protein